MTSDSDRCDVWVSIAAADVRSAVYQQLKDDLNTVEEIEVRDFKDLETSFENTNQGMTKLVKNPVVMVFWTPNYVERAQNRSTGVYREWAALCRRIRDDEDDPPAHGVVVVRVHSSEGPPSALPEYPRHVLWKEYRSDKRSDFGKIQHAITRANIRSKVGRALGTTAASAPSTAPAPAPAPSQAQAVFQTGRHAQNINSSTVHNTFGR